MPSVGRPIRVKVGTNHRSYLEKRNLFSLPFQRYEVTKIWDLYQFANVLHWKALGRINWRLNFTHSDAVLGSLLYRDIRLLHFVNSISTSKKPWVTSFETLVPRYYDVREDELAPLAAPNCRRLLAFSQCAYDFQVRHTRERFPRYAAEIEKKLAVLHPSQEVLVTDVRDRTYLNRGRLTLTLVGTEITVKGLIEVLDALEILIQRGYPVALNLIGEVTAIDYPYRVTSEQARAIEARIASKRWITHVRRMPNEDVLAIMRCTDVGLLPSYQETYGFSVLELQASGCPVVTTNVRALPEINCAASGWIIELPLTDDREMRIRGPADVEDVRNAVREGLVTTIQAIFEDPSQLERRGASAIEFIRRNHSPNENVRYLEALYDSILQ
jgi:glycosyltransferase involved in cell wall biosynthesis